MVVVWGILPLNILSLDKDKLCEGVVSIELREKVQNPASLLKVPPLNQPSVSSDEGAGPRLGASVASWLLGGSHLSGKRRHWEMPCDIVSFFPELSAMHNAREEDPDEQDKSKARLLF